METYYFDTGIFVTPILKNLDPAVTNKCRDWLTRVAAGEIAACTSFLTWDEVTWVVGKAKGTPYEAESAMRAGKLFLGLLNLQFVPVELEVVEKAQDLLQSMHLRPRDCIHASSAILKASGNLVTIDSDFGKDPSRTAEAGLRVHLISPQHPE